MNMGRFAFTQRDLTRALRAARSAGLVVQGFEVDPLTGRFVVKTNSPEVETKPADEFDQWKASHAD